MRSVCQSVNLLCTSFGSLSASGLNSLLGSWITPNLNDGKLYLVFFTLGGLMLANAAAFAGLACSFAVSRALAPGPRGVWSGWGQAWLLDLGLGAG